MKHVYGFTMIELIVVITIIAILAGVSIPIVSGLIDEAKKSRAKAEVEELHKAILRFYEDTTYWPCIGAGTDFRSVPEWNNTNNGLLSNNGGFSGWKGPYVTRQITPDPWNNSYIFDGPGRLGQSERGAGQTCVMCTGPDGRNNGTENNANRAAQGDDIALFFQ